MTDQDQLARVVQMLQEYLNTAEMVDTAYGVLRRPVNPITAGDGTCFSVQAGEYLYCTPRTNQGPWTHVEVMTITDGVEPKFWTQDAGDQLAGYVPIEDVARELISRGNLVLTPE